MDRVKIFRWLLTVGAGLVIISCWQTWEIFSLYQQGEEAAQTRGVSEAKEAVRVIEEDLAKLIRSTQTLAGELEGGALGNPDAIHERLLQEHRGNPGLHGIGIAFVPGQFLQRPRYAPYLTKRDGATVLVQVEDVYDYTDPRHGWYQEPLKAGKPVWIEPFFGAAGKAMSAEYNAPFRLPGVEGDAFSGVVTSVYSLNYLSKALNSLGLGATGYGFILSRKGNFIAHPSEEMITEGRNYRDEAARLQSPAFADAAAAALKGERDRVRIIDPETGEEAWVFFEPIPLTGWVLGVKALTQELLPDPVQVRRLLIWLAVIGSLGVLSLIWGGTFRAHGMENSTPLIIVSALSAMIYIGSIGVIWWAELAASEQSRDGLISVVDSRSLNRFEQGYRDRSQEKHLESPLFVPTGFFLQSMEFDGANNIEITGYLWQRYHRTEHTSLSQGFVLPEASSFNATESYRRKEGDSELVGWYVTATLREPFDYSRYPLDRANVWLRIWHQDFDRNVVLVPDFAAYSSMHPRSLPGIERDFVIPGWSLRSSFFAYRMQSYNTDFGIPNYVGRENFPELHFNVQIARNIINPLLSKIVSLAVVLIMLYAILCLNKKEEPLEVILGAAALFFVAMLDHVSLRENLGVNGFVYLETFYFVAYGAILLVALNSALRYSKLEFRLLEYNDNLLAKISFWPILMASLMLITAMTFY